MCVGNCGSFCSNHRAAKCFFDMRLLVSGIAVDSAAIAGLQNAFLTWAMCVWNCGSFCNNRRTAKCFFDMGLLVPGIADHSAAIIRCEADFLLNSYKQPGFPFIWKGIPGYCCPATPRSRPRLGLKQSCSLIPAFCDSLLPELTRSQQPFLRNFD